MGFSIKLKMYANKVCQNRIEKHQK